VAKELSKRLRLEAYFPWNDIEEYLQMRLTPIGLSFSDLKRDGDKVFRASHYT
jgi:thiosulfate reductase/polysulfide reductase chain A